MAVTQTQALPPQYVEDLQRDLGQQLTGLTAAPLATDLFATKVAGLDQAQKDAYTMATTTGQGIGAFQPYITQAGAYSGPTAYQPFMSPYQQQVIDTTLAEFDRQGFAGEQAIRDAAVISGNFGGGREGAQLGQFQSDRLADRAALQASLLQAGFGQAQQAADRAFTQGGQLAAAQSGLGAAQMGLSDFQRAGLGADVGALGQLGSLRQGLSQAQLQADADAARTMAYEPYGRLSQYGQALTGLSGGVVGQQYAQPQPVSPLSQAIGTALGIGGLYGKIFGFPGSK